MKRIALIRNSHALDVGGAEIFPVNLSKILENNNYEPVMYSSNKKTLLLAKTSKIKTIHSPWWSFQNFSGFKIILFPAYVVWIIMLMVWYFFSFLKNRIEVVYPQSRDDFIAATLAGKILNKKVVWSDHADLKHIYMNHKKWYKNPVGKLVYFSSKLASIVIVESFSEKRLIERSLVKALPKNYKVIHIGVVDSYKPIERHGNKLTLISTSRLVKDKGIGELIDAFTLLNNSNVVLKICGDGPDATQFRTQAKHAKNIEFLGHVEDIISQLSNSDIFLQPTYHEGFGLSLVEAEMCSLPIIASSVGSIPEIVENGVSGILVEPKNTKLLAAAIQDLIDNPTKRKKMGEAGRQIYIDNFQLDKIVKESFLPLYEK